ncbi:hypothetical protein LINPERPRIM_LOCUS38484 [Linum perenne]
MLFSDIAILFFSDIAILFFSDFTILIVDFSTPPMGHALRYGVCSLPPTPNNPRCSELLPDAGRKTICFPGELFTQQATEKDIVPPPSLKPAKSGGGKQLCSGYD